MPFFRVLSRRGWRHSLARKRYLQKIIREIYQSQAEGETPKSHLKHTVKNISSTIGLNICLVYTFLKEYLRILSKFKKSLIFIFLLF